MCMFSLVWISFLVTFYMIKSIVKLQDSSCLWIIPWGTEWLSVGCDFQGARKFLTPQKHLLCGDSMQTTWNAHRITRILDLIVKPWNWSWPEDWCCLTVSLYPPWAQGRDEWVLYELTYNFSFRLKGRNRVLNVKFFLWPDHLAFLINNL